MKPMNRFFLFTLSLITLIVIAAIVSPAHNGVRASKSTDDVCACMPAKAALMIKSTFARAQAKSAELVALNTAAGR